MQYLHQFLLTEQEGPKCLLGYSKKYLASFKKKHTCFLGPSQLIQLSHPVLSGIQFLNTSYFWSTVRLSSRLITQPCTQKTATCSAPMIFAAKFLRRGPSITTWTRQGGQEVQKCLFLSTIRVKNVHKEVKFIYSEKATKFCEIFTLLLTGFTQDKSKVKILQNFVAFSEYMNFKQVVKKGPKI